MVFVDYLCFMNAPRSPSVILFLLLLIASWSIVIAQPSDVEKELKWLRGNITLNSEEKLAGLCSYNEVNGIIYYKANDRSATIRTFHRSEILALEYVDAHRVITKKYYSLTLRNKKTQLDETGFYEMLKEYDEFAVVAKKNLVYSEKIINTSTGLHRNPKLFLRQYEQFYFLDKYGNLDFFMSVERNYLEDRFYDNLKKTGDILNKDLLSRYMGTYWPEMEQYLKDTGLRINDRSSLLQTFNYYDQLLTEPVLNFPPGMIADTTSVHDRER